MNFSSSHLGRLLGDKKPHREAPLVHPRGTFGDTSTQTKKERHGISSTISPNFEFLDFYCHLRLGDPSNTSQVNSTDFYGPSLYRSLLVIFSFGGLFGLPMTLRGDQFTTFQSEMTRPSSHYQFIFSWESN